MRGSPSPVWRGAADPIYAGSNPAPRFGVFASYTAYPMKLIFSISFLKN